MKVKLSLLLFLVALPASAQTRFLVGTEFYNGYGNTSLGIVAGVEVPIAKHFEFDLRDTFSPIESHIALGHGYQNVVEGGGLAWITQTFGLNGGVAISQYSVTKLGKLGEFGNLGVVFRSVYGDVPLRIYLNYVRELANGIDRRGIETNHLQAGEFVMEARIGCKGSVCFRSTAEFSVGGVQNQGNPACDGEWGAATCSRHYHLTGSGAAGFVVEFPRRKGTEENAF